MSVIKGLRAATARSPTIRKAVTVGALAASGGLVAGEDVDRFHNGQQERHTERQWHKKEVVHRGQGKL